MLNRPARAVFLSLAALCLLAAPALAQTDAAKAAPATVTGRVTDGKRGMVGVVVTLLPNGVGSRSQNMLSAKTEADGRYRLSGVAPGNYRIAPAAPAHVTTDASDELLGRALILNPGETVENVDFRLTRGGVITGRVTDSAGKPVIGEQVQITTEDNAQPLSRMLLVRTDRSEMLTDDRGVYRIYGLPAGRYRVSVGTSGRRGPNRAGGGVQVFYPRTFYPGVTDEAQAQIVEVTAGGETTDIDITVEKTTRQTYQVSGRFVFAETGQPAANVRVGYGQANRGGGRGGGFSGFDLVFGGGGGIVTDARGEFRAEGLASGRYVLFALNQDDAEWYSDPVIFEVSDADVEGLVAKLRRGASVSGHVVIEGVSDRATAARLLSRVRLFGHNETQGVPTAPNISTPRTVAADGSFRLGGLRAGRLNLSVSGVGGDGARLALLRVEHGGVVLPGGMIDVADNVQVTGVRVHLAYGTAVVRGQVNVVGGALPEGWQLVVNARRVGSSDGQFAGGHGSQVDSRGRFIMEGLVPGEYEFQAAALEAVGRRGGGGPRRGGGSPPSGRIMGVPLRATVAEAGEQNITLVLNLN